jgi:hypothetical protein
MMNAGGTARPAEFSPHLLDSPSYSTVLRQAIEAAEARGAPAASDLLLDF